VLNRSHVTPFLHVERGVARVRYLADADGRIVPFLDRLCRLVRRLEGWPRDTVVEALRRQERRVRDATRLAGIAKALLDVCDFRPPAGAEHAPEIRDAVFRARGARWPPVPGDHQAPYEAAAAELGRTVDDVVRLLYADAPGARVLARPPRIDGRTLLARYNLELARAVLLDAERVRVTARGGWRGIFRAVKAARLMHVVKRVGRSYTMELTGPAAAFIVRPTRYGARLARVVPALMRVPGWRLEADVRDGKTVVRFRVRGRPRAAPAAAPVGRVARTATYDSAWERSLAADFRRRLGGERGGWRLSRETTPVPVGDELFLPDFTLRHADGREALIELVGFWTPEYLESKARKVAAARLDHLILVVYRGLAVGGALAALDTLTAAVGVDRVVWFTKRPRAAEVLQAAERWARR
jgi:predicted nuclease of restriction endonuclease-like RecB superfamily